MASSKPEKKDHKSKDKKEKDKKHKRSDSDGVKKAKKEDKKEKKERKAKLAAVVEEHLLREGEEEEEEEEETEEKETEEKEKGNDEGHGRVGGNRRQKVGVQGALLPIAVPIADDKGTKKILKTIRKAAKNNALKRGVKEVTKAVRKSPPASATNTKFPGVVVLAGDIWPMDVISHLPLACEDHNIPYIYLRSRAELGDAAATKRPTSVVMVADKPGPVRKGKEGQDGKEKAAREDDGEESFADRYKALVKLVQEETGKQAFW